MTFKELKQRSVPHFYCLALDRFFPRRLRRLLRSGSALLALLSFALSFDVLPLSLGKADGLFFLFIFFYLSLSFLEFFYRSNMHQGLPSRIYDALSCPGENLDFSLSDALYRTSEIDAASGLFKSGTGPELMARAGISQESLKDFIYSDRSPIMGSSLALPADFVSLESYAAALYEADKSLQNFLSANSVNKEEFLGSAKWVSEMREKRLREERFWSRENLGAIPSMGTSWNYGISADLGRFGIPFERTADLSLFDIDNGYRAKEISALESILERREEANAVIIDDDENICRDIVGRMLRKMKLGISLPLLEHKDIVELDWEALVSSYKTKSELEAELLKILNESTAAGNIILYIRDLSGFLGSAKGAGANLASLLAPYLSSPALQVIASATNADFHFFIENSPALLERFERVIPDSAGVPATTAVLLEKALPLERQYGLIFSYPSILSLAVSADRFVTYGEMPDKAIDLMTEIAPWAAGRGITVLKENDVSIFVSEKTGIVTGTIKEKEARKIEKLEELLHRRVVGQEEAISGIASAVRRARSGINNPKRPLASFLFIGPTGVGKTESAKALAESFFGDENKMIRLDMSEYNGPNAISRLLGDFAMNKSGILASKIRDNPYSVLLLDELEKSSPDVLDLFLQVLDEGVFTDSLGRQVMCRNLIIIATSNAGSGLIWETLKSGKNLAGSKDFIVNSIIKEKIFKPELLNRFDAVVFFHPLLPKELEGVARLGLQKLGQRLKEKDLELVINDDIIQFLVQKGSDPEFGGRSVNRAIQNEVEDLIARKIVSGSAKPGSKIEIKMEELV